MHLYDQLVNWVARPIFGYSKKDPPSERGAGSMVSVYEAMQLAFVLPLLV